MVVGGDYAYVDQLYDVEVIYVANPAMPLQPGSMAVPGLILGLAAVKGQAYLATFEAGLFIVQYRCNCTNFTYLLVVGK